MRKIYNRYSEVLYCIRDDGTITDKWDVDVIGHLHSDRITDKFDIDTLFRIRSDGTISDKWDVDIIGHIRSDGTITDKWDIDRYGSVDMPESTSSGAYASSYSDSYAGGGAKHGSYFPSDYGPWNLKKTICLLITLAIQAALLLALATGKVSVAINESLQSYIIVNVIMLGNALISGILCSIAHYRIGSILSTVVNAVLGIYIFVVAITSMEGFVIFLALLFFGFIEYWVVRGGYIVSSFFCKVHR